MENTIYIRTLKNADLTVFNVSKGQKTYFDTQFNISLPYSSGQQIKYSLIEAICESLNLVRSPTTFISKVKPKGEGSQKKLEFDGEGEAYTECDPSFPDLLFGGWMKAIKGSKEKTLKRRSPLSISAMRPLHPLLAGIQKEDISFDRREMPNNKIVIKDSTGKTLTDEQVLDFINNRDGKASLTSKFIQDQKRASGLFVMDIAIDLRRLFCVSLNSFEPEMSDDTIQKLKDAGWIESKNVFGDCLVAPKDVREQWIKGLAHAIVSWKITSNQSRTFSLMDTLAISISDNANLIAGSIRAKLSEEDSRKAIPIIEENLNGVKTFVSVQASGYIPTTTEIIDAMQKAEEELVRKMKEFSYESQLH